MYAQRVDWYAITIGEQNTFRCEMSLYATQSIYIIQIELIQLIFTKVIFFWPFTQVIQPNIESNGPS